MKKEQEGRFVRVSSSREGCKAGAGRGSESFLLLQPEPSHLRRSSRTLQLGTMKESDAQMMLAADVHLGTKNCDFQMERYVWKRRNDGN
jgi:hypothetical protein